MWGHDLNLPCQQETLNDGIDMFYIFRIVRVGILIWIPVDFRMSRSQRIALANKMDLVNAVSCPTAVEEEYVILEEEKPLVLHLHWEKPVHDQVTFLSQVSLIQ